MCVCVCVCVCVCGPQRSIDERFVCVEEREVQVRRLQTALRDKDRDLERLHSILTNNEDTITVHAHTHSVVSTFRNFCIFVKYLFL